MTAHNHAEHVAGCFRCDLSREESTPTTEVVKDAVTFQRERLGEPRPIDPDAFDRWLRRVKAEVYDEAYRQGIEDERTAEELQVGIGLGGYATANRSNPYREAGDDE